MLSKSAVRSAHDGVLQRIQGCSHIVVVVQLILDVPERVLLFESVHGAEGAIYTVTTVFSGLFARLGFIESTGLTVRVVR